MKKTVKKIRTFVLSVNEKKKIRKIALCSVGSLMLLGTGVLLLPKLSEAEIAKSITYGAEEPLIELKQDQFRAEYGQPLNTEASYYVMQSDDSILEEMIVDLPIPEEGKEYLEVGTYTGSVSYKNETKDFQILVQDTTPPEFIHFQEEMKLEITEDQLPYYPEQLADQFEVYDLAGYFLEIKCSKTDVLEKPGNYELYVSALDDNGNETAKLVSLTVSITEATDEQDTLKNLSASTSADFKQDSSVLKETNAVQMSAVLSDEVSLEQAVESIKQESGVTKDMDLKKSIKQICDWLSENVRILSYGGNTVSAWKYRVGNTWTYANVMNDVLSSCGYEAELINGAKGGDIASFVIVNDDGASVYCDPFEYVQTGSEEWLYSSSIWEGLSA
jgi:hypothetical protein